MARPDKIEESLEDLGLSENEARVYVSMLSLGPATILNIAKASEVKRTTIYNILETLKEKGLARIDIRGFKKFYVAEHPKKLESMLDRWKGDLKDLLPELEAVFDLKRGESFIKYYEGAESIRNAYFELLDDLKHEDEFLVTGDPDRWEAVNESFAGAFIKARNKTKLQIRMMLVDGETANRYKRVEERFHEQIKLLPADSKIETNLVITPRKLLIQQMASPTVLVTIENKSIISMHTEFFNLMWRSL